MPGFVRTPADEKKWSTAKEAAGKETKEGSKSYWKLSNYIFHRMGKSGHDILMADLYKNELLTTNQGELVEKAEKLIKQFGGMLQMSQPSLPSIKTPLKSGTQQLSVQAPKAKKMPDPFGKPSQFFKSEDVKHPSVRKLRDFVEKKHRKH